MRLPCAPRMEAIGRWEAVGARRAAIGGCDEACDTSAGVGTSVEWNGSPAHVVDSAFGRWDRPTEWAGGASRRPETESDRRMRRRARCASSNASAAKCLGVGVRGPAPGVGPAGSRAERAGGAKRREGDVCGGGRHARARTSQPKRKGRSNAGRNGVRRAETADWRKGPRARRAHGQTGKRANGQTGKRANGQTLARRTSRAASGARCGWTAGRLGGGVQTQTGSTHRIRRKARELLAASDRKAGNAARPTKPSGRRKQDGESKTGAAEPPIASAGVAQAGSANSATAERSASA
ncbi:hypothetical protein X946_2705 [Burkholderia sp. ABCPW 111]|nr:hypothetical protein X946_2705 [Burkholderia sp. ABCPW 111]